MFDQGVAFFFVLSGFILAYVYPSLDTFGRRRFILARMARVWPAHVAALILLLLLLPATAPSVRDGHSLGILVANLFMVHAWIPLGEYFFSFNSPSWSISTEFAFYLCFLALIPNWRGTWATKLTVVFIVLVGLILLGNAWNVRGWTPADTTGLTLDGLVYISPLARLFEFTLGMATALAWTHLRPRARSGLLVGTLLEVGLVALVAYTMYQSAYWAYLAGGVGPIGSAGRVWLVHAGFSCLPFAGLILVMALELGLVSRLLAFPLLVLLGEISYSLYLIHQILLRYYAQHAPALALIPGWIAYLVFWALILLGAYVTWAMVERPARRFLVGVWPRRPTTERETGLAVSNCASPTRAGHDSLLDPGWRASLAGMVLLLILVLPIGYLMKHRSVMSVISVADADALANRGPWMARGVRFGDRFVLLGADIRRTGAGLTLELIWQSLQTQSLKYSIPVHLVNDAGTIVGQADYGQGGGAQDEVKAGTIWRDLVSIPPAKLAGATAIAIGLLDPVSTNWLLADRGLRDWGDRRLLLPLSNTPATASPPTTPSGPVFAQRPPAGANLD
jgi:peptidoglycan/LPS O-acetylase OafA/YrhL